jgi:hypothetical protein
VGYAVISVAGPEVGRGRFQPSRLAYQQHSVCRGCRSFRSSATIQLRINWRAQVVNQRHRLILRYDGGLAAQHEMDAGDSHTVIEGAKRLLAASGCYWATGQVPDRLFPQTDWFHVRHTAMRSGSCEYEFTINLVANGAWEVIRVAFDVFLIKAFLDWRERRAFEVPMHARREPYFDAPSASRTNVSDYAFEPDPEFQYDRLQGRYQQAMNQITVPLGRNTTTLDMMFEGTHLGTWTKRVSKWTEDDISEAVRAYRSSRVGREANT